MPSTDRAPQATPETKEFWDGCARGELRMPFCTSCLRYHFFPRLFCPYCLADGIEWRTVSGRGTVASFVRSMRPAPGFDLEPPFVIAIVELEEGPRLMTNVITGSDGKLAAGDDVRVTFAHTAGGYTIPRFVPAGDSA